MPLFLITQKMTAYLTVECADREEARAWGERIYATLEDEDGNPIPPDAVEEFEAESGTREMWIELLED
jgi:hypothetical protein